LVRFLQADRVLVQLPNPPPSTDGGGQYHQSSYKVSKVEGEQTTLIRAIEHNIQYLVELNMSISQLWLSVHNWDFPQVNISFSDIKQQIINDVQQF